MPVLRREMRARMRRNATHTVMAIYTSLVTAGVLAAYWAACQQGLNYSSRVDPAEVGRTIWTVGMAFQACLIPLIMPALTCSAISREREGEVLDQILLSPLTRTQIAAGKLFSAAALGWTMVLSTVPVLGVSMLLGGVSPGQMLSTLAIVIAAVPCTAGLGLMLSAFCPRSQTAAGVAYGCVGTLILGLPALTVFARWAVEASEGMALVMLAASTVLAIPPAWAGSLGLREAWVRVFDRGPIRAEIWFLFGLSWGAVLGLLHLPGVADFLATGPETAILHPGMAVLEIMYPGRGRIPTAFYSPVSTAAGLLLTGWFFWATALRLRRLRAE